MRRIIPVITFVFGAILASTIFSGCNTLMFAEEEVTGDSRIKVDPHLSIRTLATSPRKWLRVLPPAKR